jgi:tRNA (guanosine-2'-O-)-methyltransferase
MRRKGSDVYAPGNTRTLTERGVPVERVIALLEGLVTDERRARMDAVFGSRVESVTALMDSPHDPFNGAAIVRTLDAFGVQDLHVVERGETFLVSATVARGSQRWVDVHAHARTADAAGSLVERGFELVATHPEGALAPEALADIPRLCLVLGNERDGISDELKAACTRAVRVPMRGFTESLNVSVTAAILLHEANRRRAGDLPPWRRRELLARGLLATVLRSREILAASGVDVPLDAWPSPVAQAVAGAAGRLSRGAGPGEGPGPA